MDSKLTLETFHKCWDKCLKLKPIALLQSMWPEQLSAAFYPLACLSGCLKHVPVEVFSRLFTNFLPLARF